jgi:hypothetical protein
MKRISFILSLALALSSLLVAAEQTLTGQISDAMCGADHSMMKHEGQKVSARDCTLECVKGGSKYVFVSKGKVYEVKNQDLKDLEVHAGHTVKLTGEVAADGKSITVSKIAMPAQKKS